MLSHPATSRDAGILRANPFTTRGAPVTGHQEILPAQSPKDAATESTNAAKSLCTCEERLYRHRRITGLLSQTLLQSGSQPEAADCREPPVPDSKSMPSPVDELNGEDPTVFLERINRDRFMFVTTKCSGCGMKGGRLKKGAQKEHADKLDGDKHKARNGSKPR